MFLTEHLRYERILVFKMIRKIPNKINVLLTKLKLFRQLYLIRTSGLFDKKWYLEHNPDVAHAKVEPAIHYLRFGGFEGRDPGPDFSSNYYLNVHEDVKKAGMNPLVHYLMFGKYEGRRVGMANDYSNMILSNPDKKPPYLNKKIFCIGRNKTGTTSIEQILKEFGYKVGIQSDAELLIHDWAVRDFRRIIKYCETADAFQDVPFSLDYTYQVLDYAFPGAKFILTVRNNADEWYESLIRFHTKLLGLDHVPNANDLRNYSYHEKGWMWQNAQYIFGVDESTLYNRDIYKAHYENYNQRVIEYFRYRTKDLLVLNLADSFAMQSLCEFLEIKYIGQSIPHLNKSRG